MLDVGQCNADHSRISQVLKENFDVEILRAGLPDEAHRLTESHSVDLILVNRVLDSDGTAGLEIISALKSNPSTKSVPVMLVSNFKEVQHAAIQAGALPGFGKDSLHVPSTIALLGKILGS